MIAAGVFTMDPENGFPAGTPDGPVAQMSWHGITHSAAAAVSFTALAIAAIVLAVRYARRRAVPAAIGNGAAALVLLLPMSPDHMSIQIAVNGLVAFTWVALSLRRPPDLATLSRTFEKGSHEVLAAQPHPGRGLGRRDR